MPDSTGTTTPIQSASEAVSEVIGSYDPENLMSCIQVFPDMQEFYGELAKGLESLAGRLEESPLNTTLIEALREQAATLAGLGEQSGESHAEALRLHEDDINRIDNPRPGEEMADYRAHN